MKRERKAKELTEQASLLRLNHGTEMPSVSKEQRSRRPKRFFIFLFSKASQWPGCVWHQRLPDRTFPLLHLLDFSRRKLSAELLISYIGISDKLALFIYCGLLSGVRDTAFDRWRGGGKRKPRSVSQGWLRAFIWTLTASLGAACCCIVRE